MAQNAPINGSGRLTPGHAIRSLAPGVVGDAGGANGPTVSGGSAGQDYLTEIGITNTGTPLCINDALTTALSGYHQFCVGANSLGGGLISYNAYGGASQLGLSFNINGSTYGFPGPGNGNVAGPNGSNANAIAFFNGTTGTILKDNSWLLSGTNLLAPNNNSFVTSGTGVFQVGGTGGPFIFNDTALDTVSVQAKPGALPSGDTTNFQLYPPSAGQKVFLNLTALANGANEERLILGSNGVGNGYLFSQVVGGSGTCENVSFMDGESATPAWNLICGGGGNPPTLELLQGGGIVSTLSGHGPQGVLGIDNSGNLNIGAGANIAATFFHEHLGTTTAGSLPAISSCGTSPSVSGTDTAGHITIGGGTVTACTLTFATAYASGPSAVLLTGQGTGSAVLSLTSFSTTNFVIAASADIHGDVVNYFVIQ